MKWTLKEIASICGVTERQVANWRKEGMPVLKDRKGTALQVDSVAFIEWIRDRERRSAQKAHDGVDWGAEKKRIEVERMRGRLLDREETVTVWDDLMMQIAKALDAIEKRLPPLLAKKTERQARTVLHREVTTIRRRVVTYDEKRREKIRDAG